MSWTREEDEKSTEVMLQWETSMWERWRELEIIACRYDEKASRKRGRPHLYEPLPLPVPVLLPKAEGGTCTVRSVMRRQEERLSCFRAGSRLSCSPVHSSSSHLKEAQKMVLFDCGHSRHCHSHDHNHGPHLSKEEMKENIRTVKTQAQPL
jgi:hypothetical protein